MKKKHLAAAAGLLGIAAVGGTLAYFNQELSAENQLKTGKYATELVEEFTPPSEEWQPGVDVNKDVYVTNTGNAPVVVRVKFEEKWQREGASFKSNNQVDTVGNPFGSTDQKNEKDGLVEKDGTVVTKTFDSTVKKLGGDGTIEKGTIDAVTKWVYSDGWFYYTSVIDKGEASEKLLDSIELIDDADMGAFEEVKYYTTIPKDELVFKNGKVYKKDDDSELSFTGNETTGWATYTTGAVPKDATYNKSVAQLQKDVDGKELKGYSDANYTLTVTAITCQATKEAVEATFRNNDKTSCNVPKAVMEKWGMGGGTASSDSTPADEENTKTNANTVTEVTENTDTTTVTEQ